MTDGQRDKQKRYINIAFCTPAHANAREKVNMYVHMNMKGKIVQQKANGLNRPEPA